MKQKRDKPTRPPANRGKRPVLLPPAEAPADWTPPEAESPRGRIHAAARELFADRGYEGTSIRDITDAAGVNSAMVHYYFSSKEELYRRVLGMEILAAFQELQRQVSPDLPPRELLLGLPGRVARLVRANPVWTKLFRQEMAAGAHKLESVVRELQDAGPFGMKAQFERLYRAAVKRGELRRLPVDNVIQLLIILGYSGVFFDPFFRVISGEDLSDDQAFANRLKVFDAVIRHGLVSDSNKDS